MRLTDGVRESLTYFAVGLGLLAVLPLGMLCLYAVALSPEDPGLRTPAVLLGALAGAAAGLGSFVGRLLGVYRRGFWVAGALVLVGLALAAWSLALQPPLPDSSV